MEKVGFGKRLLASIIDAVIFIVIGIFTAIVTGAQIGFSMGGTGEAGVPAVPTMAILSSILIPLLYTLLEVFKAATPGKMFLGLKIANVDGTAASQDVLIKRWAIKFSASLLQAIAVITGLSLVGTLSNIAGIIVFIGCFFVLGADKQALHDKLAKTAVFKKA